MSVVLKAVLALRPAAQIALVGGDGYDDIQWGNETPIPRGEVMARAGKIIAEEAQAKAALKAKAQTDAGTLEAATGLTITEIRNVLRHA